MLTARLPSLVTTILLLSFVFWSANEGYAANISVDEDCSLSEAIHAANNDIEFDRCTAGDGEDTITLTGDVTLSGRLPTITTDLTINGSDNTVSGDDSSAIFVISDAIVTIEDLTITNGRTGTRGAAIHVDFGDLKLDGATVKDSWAGDAGGGIYAINSNVNIVGSEIKDNTAGRSGGAGVYFTSSTNGHTLNVEEWSSFSGNMASQDGGAMRVAGGIVTIDKSGFSNNSADEGGVIEIWNGSLRVENTTMSGNHAREGGAINAGADLDSATSVTVIHVTMADNTATERGAAIALTGSQATLSIGNTIISGDTDEGVTQCHPGVSEYSVIEWVRNAISDGSCLLPEPVTEEETSESNTDGDTSNQAAPSDEEISILLAPEVETLAEAQDVIEEEDELDLTGPIEDIKLAEPRTWRGVVYYPLQEGSPAIDTANQDICEELRDPDSDLVDTTRPQGDGCDIGAFEVPWEDEPPEPPEPPVEPPVEPPIEPPVETPTEEPRDCVYVVASGDSLFTIALQLDTTIEDLRVLNRLEDDLLSVGQELEAPGCAPLIDPFRPEFPYICFDIPFEIFVKSANRDVRCRLVEISEFDKHPSMNAGIKVAVEVWGRVEDGVEICFSGGGSLVLLDPAISPPAATRLSLYDSDDLKCARISRPGTVVHVLPLSDDESVPLSDCEITTANVLRLRDEAGGNEVKALVPFRVTMKARARTASWFFVDFMGMDGWISAQYVQTEGVCE